MNSLQILRAAAPARLAAVPELGELYLRWANRRTPGRPTLFLVVGGLVAAGFLWLLCTHLRETASALEWLRQRRLLLVMTACVVTAGITRRRRAAYRARAARSWLATLPVSPRSRLVESAVVIFAPVLLTVLVACAAAGLAAAAFALADLPWSDGLVAPAWLCAGALLGAGLGIVIPEPKRVPAYPGSRYVPHRTVRARRPVPSVAALGIWPIRRMFALLQPKTLARTAFPLLIAIPMGSAAGDALVLIGLLAAMTCLVSLAASMIWVMRAARRWLAPLPVSAAGVGLAVAIPAVLAMVGLVAAAVWLARIARS